MVGDTLGIVYLAFCHALDDNGLIMGKYCEEPLTFLEFIDRITVEIIEEDERLDKHDVPRILMEEPRKIGHSYLMLKCDCGEHDSTFGVFVPANSNIDLGEVTQDLRVRCGDSSDITQLIPTGESIELLGLMYSYKYEPTSIEDLEYYFFNQRFN